MAVLMLLAALAALLPAAAAVAYTFLRLVWRPYAIGKELTAQGIHGPPYRLGRGCNDDTKAMKEETDGLALDVHDHNDLPRIAPHYLSTPRICIFDYELARQILSSKSGHFVKNDPPATLLGVVGKGLALLDGIDWVRHHRVIKPAFAMDKLKMMTTTMLACAQSMIKELENQACQSRNGEIEVDFNIQFRELTADVISHAAFGSSYKLGKEIFQKQHDLMAIYLARLLDVKIPGLK
ncbi:hypothetical protein C2845_PM01G16240 [Panicum miliaceum]|uniref:Uncharacterized protein n=1 Tax=Panicum miliaceum TaxID=4540 RepID=A0A3L6TRJ0_PANMI|nr:hypothetical protein C2845_PM01G16240 [Panicum miliaceum]